MVNGPPQGMGQGKGGVQLNFEEWVRFKWIWEGQKFRLLELVFKGLGVKRKMNKTCLGIKKQYEMGMERQGILQWCSIYSNNCFPLAWEQMPRRPAVTFFLSVVLLDHRWKFYLNHQTFSYWQHIRVTTTQPPREV